MPSTRDVTRRTFRSHLIGHLRDWGELLVVLLLLPFAFVVAGVGAWLFTLGFTVFFLGGNLLIAAALAWVLALIGVH